MEAAVNDGARCSANGDSKMAGTTLMAYTMGYSVSRTRRFMPMSTPNGSAMTVPSTKLGTKRLMDEAKFSGMMSA